MKRKLLTCHKAYVSHWSERIKEQMSVCFISDAIEFEGLQPEGSPGLHSLLQHARSERTPARQTVSFSDA